MSKKLREIYEYDLIEDDGIDYTVDEWFNTIMEKTKDQLNVSDVSRMLRQKIWLSREPSKCSAMTLLSARCLRDS